MADTVLKPWQNSTYTMEELLECMGLSLGTVFKSPMITLFEDTELMVSKIYSNMVKFDYIDSVPGRTPIYYGRGDFATSWPSMFKTE